MKYVIMAGSYELAKEFAHEHELNTHVWVYANDTDKLMGFERCSPVLLAPGWETHPNYKGLSKFMQSKQFKIVTMGVPQ